MKITRIPRWPEKSRWARFFAEGAGKGGKRPYSRSVIRRPGGKCRRSGCGEESPARPRSCFCPVFCALQTKSRKASFPAVAELFKKSFGRGIPAGNPLLFDRLSSALDAAGAVAGAKGLDFGNADLVHVALNAVLERGGGHGEVDGALVLITVAQGIDEACAEAVAAAHTIHDMQGVFA